VLNRHKQGGGKTLIFWGTNENTHCKKNFKNTTIGLKPWTNTQGVEGKKQLSQHNPN
jgi:hypothetical protein